MHHNALLAVEEGAAQGKPEAERVAARLRVVEDQVAAVVLLMCVDA